MNVTSEKRTRLEQATEWAVWHFGELAFTVGPLVLAVVFTPWFALVAAIVAAGWVAHEVRDHRRQTRLKTEAAARKQLAAAPTTTTDDTTDHESREGAR